MLINPQKQDGFSIVEMLVALLISVIIAAAVLVLFTSTISNSEQVLKKGKLDRDLYALMDIIVSDVQRAGYWSNATSNQINPLMTNPADITVNSANNCVTFSYDKNANGTVQDDDEFGFRLSGNAIQFRPAGSTFDCAAPAVNWTNITDPSVIKITGFTVTKSTVVLNIDASSHTIHYRTITVSISAQLTNDASVTKTILRTIKVYNNKYVP